MSFTLEESPTTGDEVITNGGILGQILNVSESYVIIEIAPTIEITVLKSSVQTLLPKGTLRSIEPKGKSSKTKAPKTDNNKTEPVAEAQESKNTDAEKQ